MSGANHVCVEAGRLEATVVIRPLGTCTVAICGPILQYLKTLRTADTADIYFDLSRADGLDSTFAGFLVALVTAESETPIPAIHLLAPSKAVVKALERMYLLPLFDVVSTVADPPTKWEELPDAPITGEGLTDLVIQAHQELINADKRNAPAFRTLVATLRAHQKRKSAGK